MPILRKPAVNERFSASEPQIIYNSPPISAQQINEPVVNAPILNHASNDYSQTVVEPSDTTEDNIQAIVQRVIAEVTKITSIRQSTNNQELEQIIRRILNEQRHQSSSIRELSSSQSYPPRPYPSNDAINSYNRLAVEPPQETNFLKSATLQPSRQCFQNGQCDTAAAPAANSMIPLVGIRQMVNTMSYSSV